MAPARPLHEIFTALTGDAGPGRDGLADVLRDGGHPDLPDPLVREAIISYADTATAEVAEHLAPFVTSHGPVPPDDPHAAGMDVADGLELVATAPVGMPEGDAPGSAPDGGAGVVDGHGAAEFGSGDLPGTGGTEASGAAGDPFDLAFGEGGRAPGEGDRTGAPPGDAGVDPEPDPTDGASGPVEPAEPTPPGAGIGADPEDLFPLARPEPELPGPERGGAVDDGVEGG